MRYKWITRAISSFAIAAFLGTSAPAHAQMVVGGLMDMVLRNADASDYSNTTFRRFSNFNTMHVRVFFDAQPSERVSAFSQILVDGGTFQLYSAYFRIREVFGPSVHIEAGIIPTPVGAWSERAYANKNPLIGVPLVHNYHTSFVPSSSAHPRTVDDLLATRDTRSHRGLPIIYDACWNTGLQVFGTLGRLDYSVGMVTGSMTKPTTDQAKNQPQMTTRLVYSFAPGVVVGGSAWLGPYLYDGMFSDALPAGAAFSDYSNGGAGYQLYLAHRQFELHSEGFYAYWEHPWLPTMKAVSGYVEGKYKMAAQWYVAGRLGMIEPGKLTDGSGAAQPWDYPLRRYEFGLGYRANRVTTIKMVAEINRVDASPSLNHTLYALQMVVGL